MCTIRLHCTLISLLVVHIECVSMLVQCDIHQSVPFLVKHNAASVRCITQLID